MPTEKSQLQPERKEAKSRSLHTSGEQLLQQLSLRQGLPQSPNWAKTQPQLCAGEGWRRALQGLSLPARVEGLREDNEFSEFLFFLFPHLQTKTEKNYLELKQAMLLDLQSTHQYMNRRDRPVSDGRDLMLQRTVCYLCFNNTANFTGKTSPLSSRCIPTVTWM